MNKIYKVIWNVRLGLWQAVSELAKGQSKTTSKQATSSEQQVSTRFKPIGSIVIGLALLPMSVYAAIYDTALPTGASVTAGQANISKNNNSLNIHQKSQNLNTNWQSFNIGKNAIVNFIQPNQSSVAVNQIIDSNGSQIMGRLNANGQVFLNNPNGIIFSKTAQVNVGGLVASTLAVQEQSNNKNQDTFKLKGHANSKASVENHGTINALSGGTVALIAPNVKNTGSITTPNGVTHLTSSNQVTLALQDGSLTQYQISEGVLNGLVENGGAILAENGAIYLTSKGKDSLSKSVVNHTGVLEANRVSANAKGEIILLADMQTGTTIVSGVLKAEGKNGQDGGFIETSAAKVMIAEGTNVSTLADNGQTGEWLIDPTDFTIAENNGDMTASDVKKALENNNLTIESTRGKNGISGDIYVNDAIEWNKNVLTLKALNDIHINADMTATDSAGVDLQFGLATLATNSNAKLNFNKTLSVDLNGSFSAKKGSDLQNILPNFEKAPSISTFARLPQNSEIKSGKALINIQDTVMTIKQTSQDAIINWGSFNIDSGSTVEFKHSIGAQAKTINQVVGDSKSVIDGVLRANGQVLLINPTGISINAGATVDVGSLLLSTLSPSTANDFLNNRIPYSFQLANTGTGTEVINNGTLTANAGDINLIGSAISNTGSLLASNGNINLVAAEKTTATNVLSSSGILQLEFLPEVPNKVVGNGISNTGSIDAKSITGLSNSVMNIGGVINGGSFTLNTGSSSMTLGGLINTDTIDIVANEVTQVGGALSVGKLDLDTQGKVSMTSTVNMINSIDGRVGDLDLYTSNNLKFGDFETNTLHVRTSGWLSQAQNTRLNVKGTSSFSAAGGISLLQAGNRFDGTLSLRGGNAALVATGTLRLGNVNVASLDVRGDTIYLPHAVDTVGLQSYSGNLWLNGDTVLSSTLGQLALNGTLQGPYALSLLAGGPGAYIGATTTIGALSVSGGVTQLASNVATQGDISLGRAEVIGDVALASTGGAVRVGGSLNGSTPDVDSLTITAAGAVDITGNTGTGIRLRDLSLTGAQVSTAAVAIGHDLSISSGTSIVQGGAFDVGGDARFISTGNITLTNLGNQFSGDVALTGNNVQIAAQGSLSLSGVDADRLHATAGGLLTVRNADVVGNVVLSGTSVAVDNVTIGGTLDATASYGGIRQGNGTLTIGGESQLKANTDIVLDSQSNDFQGVVKAQGKVISLADKNNLILGTIDADSFRADVASDLTLQDKINTVNDISLLAGGKFINSDGVNALNSNNGRWLVLLNQIDAGHKFNGLNSLNKGLTGISSISDISESGNRYAFAENLALTLTTTNKHKVYGEVISLEDAYQVNGLLKTVSNAYLGHSVEDAVNSGIQVNSIGNMATADVANGPYTIEILPASVTSKKGYSIDSILNDGLLTVQPKDITVTATGGSSIYGDHLVNPNFTAIGLVNKQNESVLTGLSNSFGIDNNTDVGTYKLTVDGTLTNGNYNITQTNGGTWVVGKKDITVAANSGTSIYGDHLVNPNFTAIGLVNGETESVLTGLSNSFGITNKSNVGSYTLTVDGTLTNGNYNITQRTDGTWVVGKKDITVTAIGGLSTYGDNPLNPNLTASGLVNGETESVLTGLSNSFGINNASNAGSYTLTVDGTLTNGNYNITQRNDGTWVVGKKDITVTANGGSSTYGDNPLNPNLTASGLVNGETESVLTGLSNSFGITNNSNADTYTLTVDGTLTNGNYNITQRNDGTWIVGKKDITVTAIGGSSTYGDSLVNPNLTASGLVNGETESVLTGLSNSFGITNNSNADTYTLTVDGTLTNGNYNITQRTDGTWVIAKKDITVTADSLNTVYNSANQTLNGFTATGLVNGEDESILTDVKASITAKNAGTYTNKATGSAQNYELSFVDGTLTIDKAKIQAVEGITAIDRSYDATTVVGLDTSNAQFIGLLGDDALQVVNAKGNMLDKHAAKDKVVNITHIGLAGEDAQNYVLETSTAQTQVDISKAKISDITGIQIDYHTQNIIPSKNTQIKGLFEGDDVYVQQVNTALEGQIGVGVTSVKIDSLVLAGKDAENYEVINQDQLAAQVLNGGIVLLPSYERAIQHRRVNYNQVSTNQIGSFAVVETMEGGINTSGLAMLSLDLK